MAVETIEADGFTAPNCREAILAAARALYGDNGTGGILVPRGRRNPLEASIAVCERDLLRSLGDQKAATYDLVIALDIDPTHVADESVTITLTAHPPA